MTVNGQRIDLEVQVEDEKDYPERSLFHWAREYSNALPKLPEAVKVDNVLELWLSLFRAKTEEDLKNIEALEVPEMSEAIQAYRHITVTPEFREAERLRTKARHDEAQALYNAEQRRAFEIAIKLLGRNRPLEEIIEDTGLTHTEIEPLRDTN